MLQREPFWLWKVGISLFDVWILFVENCSWNWDFHNVFIDFVQISLTLLLVWPYSDVVRKRLKSLGPKEPPIMLLYSTSWSSTTLPLVQMNGLLEPAMSWPLRTVGLSLYLHGWNTTSGCWLPIKLGSVSLAITQRQCVRLMQIGRSKTQKKFVLLEIKETT